MPGSSPPAASPSPSDGRRPSTTSDDPPPAPTPPSVLLLGGRRPRRRAARRSPHRQPTSRWLQGPPRPPYFAGYPERVSIRPGHRLFSFKPSDRTTRAVTDPTTHRR